MLYIDTWTLEEVDDKLYRDKDETLGDKRQSRPIESRLLDPHSEAFSSSCDWFLLELVEACLLAIVPLELTRLMQLNGFLAEN